MEASMVISELSKALSLVKEKGHEVVSIEALEHYLAVLAEEATDSNHERARQHEIMLADFQAKNQRWMKQYEIDNSHEIEMFRSVITTGQSALRSSMIINGGAVLALLAFMGDTFQTTTFDSFKTVFQNPLWFFCMGVLCSAIAAGSTYITQLLYHHKLMKTAIVVHIITALIVIASYCVFGWACYEVAQEFVTI